MHVNFNPVNKIEARYKALRLNVKLSEVLLLCLLTAVWPFIHCLYFICKGKFHACMHIKILLDSGNQPLRGLWTSLFWISKPFISHIEEEAISLPKFSYCICTFLLLSRFQPIFVSFVAISAFVWRCFKAMSLVRIVPSQGLQIRSWILLMMDII